MQTLTYANLSDVLSAIALDTDLALDLAAEAFDNVSYGDASFTLIPAHQALENICEANQYLYIPDMTDRNVAELFYDVVGQAEYINLEG